MAHPFVNNFSHPSEFLNISSINYGKVPPLPESNNVMFVTLKFPPPPNFRVDSTVRLHLRPGVGIDTNPDNPELNSVFIVDDIIGMHVVLIALSDSWSPDLGNPNKVWGYNMRNSNVRPLMQMWNYGFGSTTSYLEYHPKDF